MRIYFSLPPAQCLFLQTFLLKKSSLHPHPVLPQLKRKTKKQTKKPMNSGTQQNHLTEKKFRQLTLQSNKTNNSFLGYSFKSICTRKYMMFPSCFALFHGDNTYFYLYCHLQKRTDYDKVFILSSLKTASISGFLRQYIYFQRWRINLQQLLLQKIQDTAQRGNNSHSY